MHTEAASNGFRVLAPAEIDLISGGQEEEMQEDIVVTGVRLQNAVSISDRGGFGFLSVGWQSGVDYCGSTLFNAPDWIGNIYIGEACYVHDQNYSEDSQVDRAVADQQLAIDIYMTLIDGGMSEQGAKTVAGIYYQGVRLGGGLSYEGQGSPR